MCLSTSWFCQTPYYLSILRFEASTPDVESKQIRPVLKKKSKSCQRKAARFCLNNYNQTAIVSDMLKELEWEMKKQQEANCGDKHKEI